MNDENNTTENNENNEVYIKLTVEQKAALNLLLSSMTVLVKDNFADLMGAKDAINNNVVPASRVEVEQTSGLELQTFDVVFECETYVSDVEVYHSVDVMDVDSGMYEGEVESTADGLPNCHFDLKGWEANSDHVEGTVTVNVVWEEEVQVVLPEGWAEHPSEYEEAVTIRNALRISMAEYGEEKEGHRFDEMVKVTRWNHRVEQEATPLPFGTSRSEYEVFETVEDALDDEALAAE